MFLCKTKILILCIGLLCVQGQVSIPPQPPASTTVVPPTSTSTTPKSTTITTSTTTTTTTIKPTTTTTTTSKPTSTSTTTQKPTTPTTAQPTTTVKPTPVPDAKPGTWSSNYTDTNRTCMVVHMAIQVEIPATQKINLPFNATSVGQCGSSPSGREILTLTWDLGNNITLLFDKTNTSKFKLSDLWVTLNTTNNTVHHYEYNKTLLEAPLENSYKCAKHQTFNLTCLDDAKQMAFLHISDIQMQAFRNVTGNNFDTALDCEGTSGRDVVPIVVGCVLAALVVLVLVGYLFGRRRCQARGYLSM